MHKILSNIAIPWPMWVLRCTKYSATLQFHGQWGVLNAQNTQQHCNSMVNGGTKMHKILSNIAIPWSMGVLRCTKYSVTLQFHGQWGY